MQAVLVAAGQPDLRKRPGDAAAMPGGAVACAAVIESHAKGAAAIAMRDIIPGRRRCWRKAPLADALDEADAEFGASSCFIWQADGLGMVLRGGGVEALGRRGGRKLCRGGGKKAPLTLDVGSLELGRD